jgi:Replication-relaxation
MNKVFSITPVHDLLLRGSQDMPVGLYHLYQATAEQLTRLHYKPGMLKTVLRRLKVLVDNGYIQADCIPTKNLRSPYYYMLDTKGMRYLQSIGLDTDPNFRSSKEVVESYLHLKHALELNDVLIAALKLKHVDPRYYLARYMHERAMRRDPYRADGITLIPGGFLDFRIRATDGPERYLGLILEHDRGTEQQEHFKRRIRAYKSLYAANGTQTMFGVKMALTAFTSFIDMKRVMQMREWTYQELRDSPQLFGSFIFAELPKPLETKHLLFDRRWYTLQDGQPISLLEG